MTHNYIEKNNDHRGTLDLIGSSVERIKEDSSLYRKLKSISIQSTSFKPPKSISNESIFLLRPSNKKKKYYFIVDSNEIDKWINILLMAIDGKESLNEKIKKNDKLPTLILHDDSFINQQSNKHNNILTSSNSIDDMDNTSERKGSNNSSISSGSTLSFRSSFSSLSYSTVNEEINSDDVMI